MLRTQSMARAQSQQQQLNSQQFGLGNGAAGGNQQQQPQTFLDSGPNQQQQSQMQPPFPTAGNLSGATSLQQSMSRNAMIQQFQASQAHGNNPNVTRQLELLLAQNQQPQNNINLAARLEQQRLQQLQGMNQSPPGDLFPSPGMVDRRPSPARHNVQSMQTVSGGQPSQQQHAPQHSPQRRMTLAELSERASILKAHIAQAEASFAQFNATRGSSPDAMFQNKMKNMSNEIKTKKEYLGKMTHAIQNMYGASSLFHWPHFNIFSWKYRTIAQHQQNGGAGASWMQQPGALQSFDNNGNLQMPRGQLGPNQQQPGPNNIHPSPSHLHSQIQPNQIPPSHSVSTPQLAANGGVSGGAGSFPNQVSPNLAQQFPFPANSAGGNASSPPSTGPTNMQQTASGNMQLPPPLEKSRFDSAYKSWSTSRNIQPDMRLMSLDGHPIDLHQLHQHVMREGGWNKVFIITSFRCFLDK